MNGRVDPSPFRNLLEGARRGDPGDVEAIYDRYVRRVLLRVRDRLTPELRRLYDSLDVTHSVVLDLLRGLDRFEDRGETAFRNWLYTSAENSVRSKLRKLRDYRGTRREIPLSGAAAQDVAAGRRGPVTHAGDREERDRLRELVGDLDERHRRILELRLGEKLPFREIAARLDIRTANAARMRYSRALLLLRERWSAD